MAGLTAGLLLQVVLFHLIDQNWFAFAKDPNYVQVGYTLIELIGLVVAAGLLIRRHWVLWLAALGTASGPLFGFIASRSVGLPGYTDDIGNWTEPLAVVAVLVELTVMGICLWMLRARLRQR